MTVLPRDICVPSVTANIFKNSQIHRDGIGVRVGLFIYVVRLSTVYSLRGRDDAGGVSRVVQYKSLPFYTDHVKSLWRWAEVFRCGKRLCPCVSGQVDTCGIWCVCVCGSTVLGEVRFVWVEV